MSSQLQKQDETVGVFVFLSAQTPATVKVSESSFVQSVTLPPYVSLLLSLSVTLNLFHNTAFTPQDTNRVEVGQGRGGFTASICFF